MEFRTTLQLTGKTSTGFVIPPEVVEALGGGKRPPVVVTINGYSYRNTVAPMGGEYWLGVSAAHRQAAGLKAGDELQVELELDLEPREIEVPADFAAALDARPEARRMFDGLSYSNQRYHVERIDGAKSAETRQRRIAQTVEMLAAGRKR
jgi:hypothetical protein